MLVFILLLFISDPLNGNNDSCFHELHLSDPKTKGEHGKRKPDQRQAKPNKSYTERLTAMFPPPCSLHTGKASLAPGWRKWRKCAGFTINKHLPELWSGCGRRNFSALCLKLMREVAGRGQRSKQLISSIKEVAVSQLSGLACSLSYATQQCEGFLLHKQRLPCSMLCFLNYISDSKQGNMFNIDPKNKVWSESSSSSWRQAYLYGATHTSNLMDSPTKKSWSLLKTGVYICCESTRENVQEVIWS